MKKIFKIYGLDCVSCKFKLEKLLDDIEGLNAEIDFESEIAKIEFYNLEAQEKFLKKVKEAGYQAVEI